MDCSSADNLPHLLEVFEQSIAITARHMNNADTSGTWCASAPYYEKCRVKNSLASSSGTDSDQEYFLREYDRIVGNLGSFTSHAGMKYRDHLFSDLRQCVHAYHASVCLGHLGHTGPGSSGDPLWRDLIGELCGVLQDQYDLTDINALIALVDGNNPDRIVSAPEDLPEPTQEWRTCHCHAHPGGNGHPAERKSGSVGPE